MHWMLERGLLAVITVSSLAGVAEGQVLVGLEQVTWDDKINRLEERIQQLEAENNRQAEEIDELHALNDDNWLTEQRAEEIRSLISETLADVDTRSSLLDAGLTAGWNDHYFLASHDGRFRLQLDGQIQFRWMWNYHDQPDHHRHGFEFTRTKLTFRGHVFNPDLTFLIRTDVTRNEPGLVTGLYFLRDAWFRYRLNNEWTVRFGRFKLPFTREELVPSQYQQAVERSLVNESMNLGRTDGVEFTYADRTKKFIFMYSEGAIDSLGGFGIAGQSGGVTSMTAGVGDTEYAITTRGEYLLAGNWQQFADFTSPLGEEFGMMVGGALHWEESESQGGFSFGRDETRWYGATLDASLEWGGANVFASGAWHYVDAPNFHTQTWGWVVQAGAYFTPKLEFFARWEYGWWDTAAASFPDLNLLTIGANYYFDGHDLKLSMDFGYGFSVIDDAWDSDIAQWRPESAPNDPQIVFRTQFQLLF